MNTGMIFLLVAVGGSHSGPSTLAKFNDERVCLFAAKMLQDQARARTGSPNVYAYCIPALASAVVK